MAFASLKEGFALLHQFGDCFACICVEAIFANNVTGHLLNPCLQTFNGLANTEIFDLQRFALYRQTLQNCGGGCLLLTFGGKGSFGLLTRLGGLDRGCLSLRCRLHGQAQGFLRPCAGLICLTPAQI